MRGFRFLARATHAFPAVVKARVAGGGGSGQDLEFSLTQVGNSSVKDVEIINPSNRDVYFHIVPLNVYPNGAKLAKSLPLVHEAVSEVNFTSDLAPGTFTVISVIDAGTKQPLRSYADDVEATLGRQVHPETKAFILKPGIKAKVRVRFRPQAPGEFKQGLFVRNNLTGVELVTYGASSVLGSLEFAGKRSDHLIVGGEVGSRDGFGLGFGLNNFQDRMSENPVVKFAINEDHLHFCTRE